MNDRTLPIGIVCKIVFFNRQMMKTRCRKSKILWFYSLYSSAVTLFDHLF